LSHHPQCEKFKNHTISLYNTKLCIGCFIGYPSAVVSWGLIRLFRLYEIIPSDLFLLFGFLFLGMFILGPIKLIRSKRSKIIQKALNGTGGVLILFWIASLPNPFETNVFLMYSTGWTLLIIFNAYHVLGNIRICFRCETPFDWNNCGGFDMVKNKMIKYNIDNIFTSMDELSLKITEKRKTKK